MKKSQLIFANCISGLCLVGSVLAQTTLVPAGSYWKYLDNGTNQGTAWKEPSFNDANWAAGNAELGYGNGDEATVVSYGPSSTSKYITTYFRKTIAIPNVNAISDIVLNVKRDDGVVIYINGVEAFRDNMPSGTISYTTVALSNASDNGTTWFPKTMENSMFVNGNNVIAVEIHQRSASSSDISFDFKLEATPVTLVELPSGPQTFAAAGGLWKYYDKGSKVGLLWKELSFDDSSWLSGNAELGYGDGDETTVVGYGPKANSKYITTYFRKSINVEDITVLSDASIKVRRDDGVVVYINGIERYRNNMPTGTISYSTLASTDAVDDGKTWFSETIPASAFVKGANLIAVEIHQKTASSPDISFDLELIGNYPVQSTNTATALLIRGPYLQIGTPNSMTIQWRSDVATDSRVFYGTAFNNLTSVTTVPSVVNDHVVKLSGLIPNTIYYYSIGSSTQVLQGDNSNYFKTSPIKGSEQKTRIWVTGDCGNNSTNQLNVRNKYHSYIENNVTDVWMLLGDNAYNEGLDNEYQTNFFNIYKDKMLKQTVLWPAPGNHEYASNATLQNSKNIPYYDIFNLPMNAEAGGIASGSESYYSYDYANIHFISLDSYGKESSQYRLYDTLGPQVVWLKNDLAANTQKWTVVYWHHPPYTMGSHNSDTKDELIYIRENLVKILERYKVDLVLCGHSHLYERSKLMLGHYGKEATFDAAIHNVSNSTAKYDGSTNSCPYHKNEANGYKGAVFVVTGSAGKQGTTQLAYPHDAMYYSNATNGGSLLLEVESNRLDAKWLCADGVIRDQFTLVKDVNKTNNITIQAGQSVTLTASWVGNYSWNPSGAAGRSITVNPTVNTTYAVSDGINCISDEFNITIASSSRIINSGSDKSNENVDHLSLQVFPNPIHSTASIEYSTPSVGDVKLEIHDMKGQRIKTLVDGAQENGIYSYELSDVKEILKAGIYFVTLSFGEHQITQKISVLE